MSVTLLASAASLDSIKDCIRRFYCGGAKNLEPIDVDEWRLTSIHSGRLLEGVRVVRKRGRFRFEATS